MAKIDLEKFICSMIESNEYGEFIYGKALKDQGLEYKDGKIVEIGFQNPSAPKEAEKDYRSIDPYFCKSITNKTEIKPFEIKAGHWYMCIQNYELPLITPFKKGVVYKAVLNGVLLGEDKEKWPFGNAKDWFRPATEDEIPHKPKFKVGDWVANNSGCFFKVTRLDKKSSCYIIEDTFGNVDMELQKEIDKNCHLWAIQDAKDGDVLSYSDSRHIWICIFKEVKNSRIYDYCSYNETGSKIGFYPTKNWNYDKTLKYSPATQKQRELLFEKIAESGYIWDSYNKQLSKKPEPTDVPDKTIVLRVESKKEEIDEDSIINAQKESFKQGALKVLKEIEDAMRLGSAPHVSMMFVLQKIKELKSEL